VARYYRAHGVAGASVGVPVAAVAMGARAAIDQTQGWHKTLSNVPLADVDGLGADVTFDIQDADCVARAAEGLRNRVVGCRRRAGRRDIVPAGDELASPDHVETLVSDFGE